jgi:hypothetical protein
MSGYAEWSPATAYTVNDIVHWQGVVYVCVQININQQPPNSLYWAAQGGAAGVSSIEGLQGTVTLSSPDSSVGIAVVGQDIRLTAAGGGGGVTSLNGATGAINITAGPGIGVAVAPGTIAISTSSSAVAFADSVGINPVGGINPGTTFSVATSGLYLICVTATFGAGAGATPIELDESLGNYVQVRFRNTPPGATFDAFVNVPAPPTIATPGAGASYTTTTTTIVSWASGVDKEFQVQVQNAGAGGISWDPLSSAVGVTILRLT